MGFTRIAVLGLGKVGLLAANLLHEEGFQVTGCDQRASAEEQRFAVKPIDVASAEALSAELSRQEAVLSCLPYHLNQHVAKIAHRLGIHYFDLTEDVPTTEAIQELAKTSKGVMAPQCGLAPGFVGIVASSQDRKSVV